MSLGVKAFVLGILTLTVGVLASPVLAGTITASSCDSSPVQAAINNAASGDTVQVPAGSCSNWNVTIPDTKRITLQGAGAGVTTINGGLLALSRSGSRVTGFTFNAVLLGIDGNDWRVDHNILIGLGPNTEVIIVQGSDPTGIHPRGVIDHNTFRNGGRVLVLGYTTDTGILGAWAMPTGLGSAQTVFIEDNTFDFFGANLSDPVDTNYAGRFVFRYNRANNASVEVHSLQQRRASRSWEIYNNTFTADPRGSWTPMFIRGGTGVAFNNTFLGPWSDSNITLDNVRSFSSGYEYGNCDGTSPADGNQLANGWPCRDQIGRGQDAFVWVPTTGQRSPGYFNYPWPGTGAPPQASEPAYFWNNTRPNGSLAGISINNGVNAYIVSGRDYILNTAKPGYTPYQYPHPLTNGGTSGGPVPPPAPTNLTVR